MMMNITLVQMMMIVVLGKAPGQGKKPLALEQFFEGWGSSEQYFWSCVFSQSVWWSIRQKTYEGNKEKTYEGDEEKNLQAVFSTGPPPKSSKYKKVDQG